VAKKKTNISISPTISEYETVDTSLDSIHGEGDRDMLEVASRIVAGARPIEAVDRTFNPVIRYGNLPASACQDFLRDEKVKIITIMRELMGEFGSSRMSASGKRYLASYDRAQRRKRAQYKKERDSEK